MKMVTDCILQHQLGSFMDTDTLVVLGIRGILFEGCLPGNKAGTIHWTLLASQCRENQLLLFGSAGKNYEAITRGS